VDFKHFKNKVLLSSRGCYSVTIDRNIVILTANYYAVITFSIHKNSSFGRRKSRDCSVL